MIRKIFIVIAGAASALTLAACTSGPAGSAGIDAVTPAPSTPVSSAPVATPTPTVTAKPTATGTPTPTRPAVKPCTGADLKITVGTGQGAAGTLINRFLVTNTSTSTCTMKGHPGIVPFALSGTAKTNIGVDVDPIPANFGDLGQPAALETLAPHDQVAFFLKWSDVPTGNATCPDAAGFDFTPPGTDPDNRIEVDLTFSPCGTDIQVSNIVPTTVG